jgi:LysM repeat protein
MVRLLACVLLGWAVPPELLSQKNSDALMDSLREDYIRRYKDIAMEEMERHGIPASIKLAQALLETRAGTSELAQKANNHFGLKCGKNWQGETYAKNDDEFDTKGRPVLSCFRKYGHVVASYADHSAFLLLPEKKQRYGFLFELDPLDYRGWAEGLQKAGYSPVSHYAERLIFYIEHHRLYEYDRLVQEGRLALKRIATVNGARMVQARAGETLRAIAQLYQVPVDSLVLYNDSLYTSDISLQVGDPVFIEPKGEAPEALAPIVHRAEKDQTLRHIAQRYGLRTAALQRFNPGLAADAPLPANRLVYLKAAPPEKRPALALKGVPTKRDTLPLAEAEQSAAAAHPSPSVFTLVAEKTSSESASTTINMRTGEVEIYHRVGAGDTLYSIARRYQTTPERIRRLNPDLKEVIRPGQTLRVQ